MAPGVFGASCTPQQHVFRQINSIDTGAVELLYTPERVMMPKR